MAVADAYPFVMVEGCRMAQLPARGLAAKPLNAPRAWPAALRGRLHWAPGRPMVLRRCAARADRPPTHWRHVAAGMPVRRHGCGGRCAATARTGTGPARKKGDAWAVPIPVGCAALSPRQEAATMAHARDMATPLRLVESVHALGGRVSPQRLRDVQQLLWRAEVDEAKGLDRCRNDHQPQPELAQRARARRQPSLGALQPGWAPR